MPKTDPRIDDFERSLRGRGYKPLKPFFVLREGDITDERNGGVVRLTKARLEKIADIQNQRTASTGDATPIIIGHTKRGAQEKDQPPITGYAPRWEVVKFYRTNTWGLQTVPWATDADVGNFEKYPRRSAELWTDPDLLDPISLLGANTPRLDLGLHQLHRAGTYQERAPLILEMDEMPEDTANQPAGNDPAANPDNSTNTDGFAALKAAVDKITQQMTLLQPLLDELAQSPQGGGAAAGGDPMAMGAGGPPMGGAPAGPPPVGGPPMGGAMGGPPMPPEPPGPVQAGYAYGAPIMQPQQYGFDAYGRPVQLAYGQQPQPAPQPAGPTTAEVQQLRTQVAALQMQRLETDVAHTLAVLANEITVDQTPTGRDYQTLLRLSRQEQGVEIAHWKNTRKPVEMQLPPEGVPQNYQAGIPGGPVQMARPISGGGFVMPGDPSLANPGPPSEYDRLTAIVRGRGNMSAEDAYEAAMKQSRPGNVTPLRQG